MQRRIFSLLAIALLLAAAGLAQDTRGAISGRITDPSGAVVAGAQVTVTNSGMGTRTALTTNSEGIYRASLLPPGMYQIEVTAAGFKKVVRNDIEVRVADRIDVNMTLEIGASEQAITITAETPLLNAETASLGTVVDSKR